MCYKGKGCREHYPFRLAAQRIKMVIHPTKTHARPPNMIAIVIVLSRASINVVKLRKPF
jgi:hypothetical protein